jgi:hypothetical protein
MFLEVVLTFEDNPRKVGVRFDKPIVGGINLGGICEDQHGYFVDVVDLKHENSLEEGSEGIIVYVLSTLSLFLKIIYSLSLSLFVCLSPRLALFQLNKEGRKSILNL